MIRVLGPLRRHWLLAIIGVAGLALRALTQIAYHPALLYIDSDKYLHRSFGADPVGYRVMLRPLQLGHGLTLVAAAQHILGLAMAVALYAVLCRRGVPRWAAAIAGAPVLLDAYQLEAEQTIMPDVMFEALIVAGLAVLLWRPKPGPRLVAVAGLALGAATDVRQVGEVLILPAVVFVLVVAVGWRCRLSQGALMVVSFAVPVVAYMSAAEAVTGHFGLTKRGVDVLYGRSAFAADCSTLKLPAYERALCPPRSVAVTLGIDGIINKPQGSLQTYTPPAGMAIRSAKTDFEAAVFKQQPLAVPLSVTRDFVKLFALTRGQSPGDTPISRWQFQTAYPTYPPGITLQFLDRMTHGREKPGVAVPLAVMLRDYQLYGGYTPGPFLALAGVIGLTGAFGLTGRHRRATQALAGACLLASATALAVLLGSDFFQFSWRYQLPGLVTLPPAGALGVAAVATRVKLARQARQNSASAPQESAEPELATGPGLGT